MARLRFIAWLFLASALFAGGTVTLSPSVAWAQDAEIEGLLRGAIEDYDVLEIETAREKIDEGINKAANANITAGELLGKLYIMQGVIEYAASGDEEAVQESFRQALVAEPTMDVPDVYRTPDLEKILEKAREQVGASGPDRPPSGAGITHNAMTDVDARESVIFEAFVPRDMPVYKMFVFFRVMGDERWKKVEMQPTNAERFAVQVRGNEFHASQFDYYIVAEDRGGNPVGNSGGAESPHNVVVLGSGDVDKPNGGEGNGNEKPDKPKTPGDTIMYVGTTFGTSPSLLTGAENNMPTAHPDRDVSPGLAIGFAHFALDLGVTLTPKMYLGLMFRFQFAPAQPFEGLPPTTTTGGGFPTTKAECLGLGLPGDCILGLKYRLFVNDSDKFRVFTSLGAGVGRVRNWLRLKQVTDGPTGEALCAPPKKLQTGTNSAGDPVEFCYIRDTVRTGWLHFGVGGGAAIRVNDFTDILLDSYLMILAPTTSVNLDLSGGLMFKF